MEILSGIKKKIKGVKAELKGHTHTKKERSKYTVGAILREYLPAYRKKYRLSVEQERVVGALMACRTGLLGGRIEICQACGAYQFWYYSCRDRHCPTCCKFKKAEWVEKQKVVILPIPYFHVTFTIDHLINPLVPANRRLIYDLLFRTVNEVTQAFSEHYLGGEIGFTAALHTWGQTMQPHVHLHCIMTGGALTRDGQAWRPAKKRFLFPAEKFSEVFRDRFCEGLGALHQEGLLKLVGQCEGLDVEALIEQMVSKRWELFIKPFDDPEKVYEYLSRYVHQVAISNHRIVKVEEGKVTFRYHDNRAGGKEKEMTLEAVEFIRRFVWHVLPDNFHRLRHFGLHNAGQRKRKLGRVRELLGLERELPQAKKFELKAWLQEILGEEEVDRCPRCGAVGAMSVWREFDKINWIQGWFMGLMGLEPYGQVVG